MATVSSSVRVTTRSSAVCSTLPWRVSQSATMVRASVRPVARVMTRAWRPATACSSSCDWASVRTSCSAVSRKASPAGVSRTGPPPGSTRGVPAQASSAADAPPEGRMGDMAQLGRAREAALLGQQQEVFQPFALHGRASLPSQAAAASCSVWRVAWAAVRAAAAKSSPCDA